MSVIAGATSVFCSSFVFMHHPATHVRANVAKMFRGRQKCSRETTLQTSLGFLLVEVDVHGASKTIPHGVGTRVPHGGVFGASGLAQAPSALDCWLAAGGRRSLRPR